MVTYRLAAKTAFIGNYGAKNKYSDRVKSGIGFASNLCFTGIIRTIYSVLKWLVFNRQNTGKIKFDYIPRLGQKKCKVKRSLPIAIIMPIAKFVPCREFHTCMKNPTYDISYM